MTFKKIILALWVLFLFSSVSAQLSAPNHYWKFNEANGTTLAVDSGSSPKNLQLNYSYANLDVGKLNNGLRLYAEAGNIMVNGTNDAANAFGTGNFTIAFWFNSSSGGGSNFFMGTDYASNGWTISRNGANLEFLAGGVVRASIVNALNGSWNRIVFARETTGANNTKIYVNKNNIQNFTLADDITLNTGTFKIYTPNYNPYYMIDDLRVYKAYVWSVSDVVTDWNSGSGQEIGSTSFVSTTLSTPANASLVATTPISLTATVSPVSPSALANATVYVYNSTGLFNRTTISLSGTSSTNAQFNMTLPFNTYYWNVYACATNSSGSGCATGTSNYTLYVNYTINSQTYSNPIAESSTDTITLNISIPSYYTLSSATLFYNGTTYSSPSIVYETSDILRLSKQVMTPFTSTASNATFYWNLTLTNGQVLTTTLTNQTIANVAIGSCSVYPQLIVNYSVFDEDTFNALTGQASNVTVQTYILFKTLSGSSIISTFNRTFAGVNTTTPAQVCVADGVINSTSYRLDITTTYSAFGHEPESYDIQNYTINLTTAPLSINLYDLLTTNAQQFKLIYYNDFLLPVANVIIEVQRFYTGLGSFYNVEAPTTGVDGSTVASLVINDEVYNFYIKRDGQIIDSFLNKRMFCSSSINECTYSMYSFNSGGQVSTSQNFEGVQFYSLYNSTVRTYRTAFNVGDGSTKTIAINITIPSNSTQICYNSQSASSGVLTCQITGTYPVETAQAKIYIDGILAMTDYFTIEKLTNQTYGLLRILLAIVIIITLVGTFSSSKEMMLVGLLIGIFISSSLWLIDLGSTFGQTGVILLTVVAIFIMIWNFSRRNT